MRVIIENYSRVPLPVAVLMVFLKLNGNSDKEKRETCGNRKAGKKSMERSLQ